MRARMRESIRPLPLSIFFAVQESSPWLFFFPGGNFLVGSRIRAQAVFFSWGQHEDKGKLQKRRALPEGRAKFCTMTRRGEVQNGTIQKQGPSAVTSCRWAYTPLSKGGNAGVLKLLRGKVRWGVHWCPSSEKGSMLGSKTWSTLMRSHRSRRWTANYLQGPGWNNGEKGSKPRCKVSETTPFFLVIQDRAVPPMSWERFFLFRMELFRPCPENVFFFLPVLGLSGPWLFNRPPANGEAQNSKLQCLLFAEWLESNFRILGFEAKASCRTNGCRDHEFGRNLTRHGYEKHRDFFWTIPNARRA